MLLRRNSVQALFNGYYHDDNIAAINAKNPPPRMIEEHIPSNCSPNTNSQQTSLPQSVAQGGTVVEPSANSATNSNINTLQQSMHHNVVFQQSTSLQIQP